MAQCSLKFERYSTLIRLQPLLNFDLKLYQYLYPLLSSCHRSLSLLIFFSVLAHDHEIQVPAIAPWHCST